MATIQQRTMKEAEQNKLDVALYRRGTSVCVAWDRTVKNGDIRYRVEVVEAETAGQARRTVELFDILTNVSQTPVGRLRVAVAFAAAEPEAARIRSHR